MKRIIAALLVLVAITAVLSSCGKVEPTHVTVRFVTWEGFDSKKEQEIKTYDVEITTADPNLFTVMRQLEGEDAEIKPVYGEGDDGSPTAPTSYFGKEQKDDETVTPHMLYRWFAYISAGEAKLDQSSVTLTEAEWSSRTIANGEVITFVYAWWQVGSDE